MKKNYIRLLIAIFSIAFVSCSKAIEEDPITDESRTPEEVVDQEGNIIEIIGTIKDDALTKTQYTEDEDTYTFSWTSGDYIKLVVYNNGNNSLNHFTLSALSTSSSSKFSTDPIGDAATASYPQTGFAIYPIYNPNLSDLSLNPFDYLNYSGTKNNVQVVLRGSYTLPEASLITPINQLSCTPLVGNRIGETNEYEFGTAVGVLMISLTNVPSTAKAIKIISPSEEAPLSGTFKLVSGSKAISMNQRTSSSSSDLSRTVSFTPDAEVTNYTFYIPVPVGTIPVVDGKGLKIQLLDNTDHPVFSRSYTKSLEIVRNQIIPVTLEAPDWKKLGTGKFIDNWMWGYLIKKRGYDKDIFGYIDVDIYQNVTDPYQYRIKNPYGNAISKYSISHGTPSYGTYSYEDPSEFLTITVDSETSVPSFADHVTGITIDGYNDEIKLKDVDSAKDILVVGTATNPKVIQLAPKYMYKDDRAGYDQSGYRNMIHIVFPDADDYTASVTTSISDMSSVSIVASPNLTTRVTLSTFNDVQLASSLNGYNCNAYDKFPNYRQDNTSNQTIDWSDGAVTGEMYLCWFVRDGSYNMVSQGSTKVPYALSKTDANIVLGTFLRDISQGTPSNSAFDSDLSLQGSNTLIIEASNDVNKSNVMISGFAGYTSDSSGSPLYGTYSPSSGNVVFPIDGDEDVFCNDGNNNLYVTPCTNQLNPSAITLKFEGSKVNNVSTWLGVSYDNWVGSDSKYKVYYTGYTAYKTSGQIALTEDMISASSTHGSDDVSHLVDKDAGTIWHAEYSGTHALDENYGIYLDIDLGNGNTVTNFTIMFQNRNQYVYNYPNKYKVYGYNTSTGTWDVLTGSDPINAVGGDDRSGLWSQCRISDNVTPYRKIRLSIIETTCDGGVFDLLTTSAENNQGTTHLAELQLWEN